MNHNDNEIFSRVVLENFGLILDALKIKYNENGDRFYFPCPLHDSDNFDSMSVYKNTGIGICFVRHCLAFVGKGYGVLRVISALLDLPKYKGYPDAITFCKNVLEGIEYNPYEIEKKLERKTEEVIYKGVSRSLIVPHVNPNIEFYLRRGYTKEIIEKYDIFICKKKSNLLYGRVTIPIYNDDHTEAVGFMGRSLNPQCSICKRYHTMSSGCPNTSYEKIKSQKWLNSKGMSRNKLLFNYWYAKEYIEESGDVILVESPGNVMKIVQAGFNNVVGMFGTILSKNQSKKLDELGVKRIFLGLDKDDAGLVAADNISNQLSKYECIPLIPPVNDYGDMVEDEIISFFSKYDILK